MCIRVRKLKPQDYDKKIRSKLNKFIDNFYSNYKVKPHFLQYFWEYVSNVIIAEDDTEIIGMLVTNRIMTLAKKSLIIDEVFVDEKYRKQGIATKLVEYCVNYAKENDYDCIELLVNNDNNSALNLYCKCGFDETNKTHMVKILKEWEKK